MLSHHQVVVFGTQAYATETPFPKRNPLRCKICASLPQEAWGWTAWRRWSEMSDAERRGGRYAYLENFKLLLAPEGEYGWAVDTVCPLPAGLTAVQVVADFLTAPAQAWCSCWSPPPCL